MLQHDHEHSHSHDSNSNNVVNLSGKKIFWVTLLNASITIMEIIGGILSGSLALLSDALHNLSDTIAIALSYFANRIAQKPKDRINTYRYKRAEILAAFVNSSVLLAISFWLIYEAINRFREPESIDGTLMIAVAFIGLFANLISVLILEKDSHESLNIKSSYLHLISDTVSSVGVLLGGLAIKLWGIIWIDPLITLLISIYIVRETWNVIKNTVNILMQSSPSLDYEGIKKDIEALESIKNIHHIHSWMVNEKTIMFEAHIEIENMQLSEVEIIYNKVEHLLIEKYGISHITLQPEVNRCRDNGIALNNF